MIKIRFKIVLIQYDGLVAIKQNERIWNNFFYIINVADWPVRPVRYK